MPSAGDPRGLTGRTIRQHPAPVGPRSVGSASVTVGEQVQIALDHWSVGDWRSAMWHATAALDETAAKRYPLLGPAPRFRRIVRDDLDIFAALTAPDINLVESRFPVPVSSDQLDSRPDIADLLYGVHQYLH